MLASCLHTTCAGSKGELTLQLPEWMSGLQLGAQARLVEVGLGNVSQQPQLGPDAPKQEGKRLLQANYELRKELTGNGQLHVSCDKLLQHWREAASCALEHLLSTPPHKGTLSGARSAQGHMAHFCNEQRCLSA